jgi:antibiotic biosynthesis monooxygenase (ABM) superfamily enzyme
MALMNSSIELQEQQPPQPATAIASHRVLPEKLEEYCEAQNAITNAARSFPGFVGTEVLAPVPGLQEEWIAIFRLESNQAMKRWLQSSERAKPAARIESCLSQPSQMLLLASDDDAEPPVAMVIACRVRPERMDDYLSWRRRTIAAQAHYPGYFATEFFPPNGKFQNEWVDIVRYRSLADLTHWMESKERQVLVNELSTIAETVHAHQITGFEGWFALNRGPGRVVVPPPSWKQALAVLFALYPTLMVLSLLNPLMRSLSFPVRMLMGNIFSVALLTWLVMPGATRFLGFWLNSHGDDWKPEALGLLTVAGTLAVFALIFRVV